MQHAPHFPNLASRPLPTGGQSSQQQNMGYNSSQTVRQASKYDTSSMQASNRDQARRLGCS